MRKTWRNLNVAPTPIIADAGLATYGIGEGRLIPVLIIDTSERPDIEDLVKIHEKLPPGDVAIQWGRLNGSKENIALIMEFTRPSEANLILNFNIESQGGLVDIILHAKGLYIMPCCEVDIFINTMDDAKIIIEIPDTGIKDVWDDVWHKAVLKVFRRRGLSRAEAKVASRDFIDKIRSVTKLRMR